MLALKIPIVLAPVTIDGVCIINNINRKFELSSSAGRPKTSQRPTLQRQGVEQSVSHSCISIHGLMLNEQSLMVKQRLS